MYNILTIVESIWPIKSDVHVHENSCVLHASKRHKQTHTQQTNKQPLWLRKIISHNGLEK